MGPVPALVCVAAGAGLRWGECAGLSWDAVDLVKGRLHVVQVAVETPSTVTLDMYTHTPDDYESRVTAALNGDDAFSLPVDTEPAEEGEDEDDADAL